MSGILGLLDSARTDINTEAFQAMQDAVAHRGPNGQGMWADANVGIAHQLLWTTPESVFEASPFIDISNGRVITADVRLDNRAELIQALHLEEAPDLTDPLILLSAYEKWGASCPEKLLGAFAFVIWDPNRRQFFGARDHFGVKPFYYFSNDRLFAFASEIKALLRSPDIPNLLNEVKIAELLTSNIGNQSNTAFVNIYRLPAAHTLVCHQTGRVEIHPYWSLKLNQAQSCKSDADYAQTFAKLFAEAVRCRLRRWGSVGSQLSGGLDSSSVTCVAKNIMERADSSTPLKTFSAIFPTVPECDEQTYIETVLAQGEVQAYTLRADQSGPLTHWQEIFRCLDEPALGNGYLSWMINQAASQAHVRILLNGYDGDTTVGHGTLYPSELAQQGDWQAALREANALAEKIKAPGLSAQTVMRHHTLPALYRFAHRGDWRKFGTGVHHLHRPLGLSALKLWVQCGLKTVLKKGYHRIRRQIGLKKTLDSAQLLSEQFPYLQNQFITRPDIVSHLKQLKQQSPVPQTTQEEQWQKLSSGTISFPMELLDLVSAPFGIEPRYPFMDKRLVEFCLNLPPDQKLRQGWTRYILRQAMEGILPPEIQWRPTKTNLTQSFCDGLQKYDQSTLAMFNNRSPNKIHDYIDLKMLNQICQSMSTKPSRIRDVWPAITLVAWFHQFKK